MRFEYSSHTRPLAEHPPTMEIPREVRDELPRPELVEVPRLGGSSHRFALDTLPRWKEGLADLMGRDDTYHGGVVFEIHPEEPFDPTLMGPVFDAVEHSPWITPAPVAFFVHIESVAEDLLNFGTWKAQAIPANRRPALQVARSDGSGNVTLVVDAHLHGWADDALPLLVELPLFSAALLRTMGMPSESAGEDGIPPRLVSDRVSALAKAGLITEAPQERHDLIAGYIEKHVGSQLWRRPPHVYASRPFLLKRLVESTLGQRLRSARRARRF